MQFDLNKFYGVLSELGVDAQELTNVQLDRYIQEFRNGAVTADDLRAAVANPPRYPETFRLYAHFNQEDLEAVGEQLNLTGDALRRFVGPHIPLELTCSVESDGSLIIEEVHEIPLAWGVAL